MSQSGNKIISVVLCCFLSLILLPQTLADSIAEAPDSAVTTDSGDNIDNTDEGPGAVGEGSVNPEGGIGGNGDGGAYTDDGVLRYAEDRVVVKLAAIPPSQSFSMFSEGEAPASTGTARSDTATPDLGIAYTEIRLLNPSLGTTQLRTEGLSVMSVAEEQDNVFVLTLEEKGAAAVENALSVLNANPLVAIAEPDYYFQALVKPNDPYYSYQYALQKINAEQAWEITKGSKSVAVGIIDTGLLAGLEEFDNNLWTHPADLQCGYSNDIHGYDFWNKTGGTPTDLYGHGTNVAGILGAVGNNGTGICGVNWEVSLVWMGILDNDDEENLNLSMSAAIDALNYANNHQIMITNNSYGGHDYSKIFEDAVRNYKGLFIAAAGNEEVNCDVKPVYPACFDCPNIISVAGTTQNDTLSSKSNYGNIVDIAAPGERIYSTGLNGMYAYYSGTSMAAPQVSGVAALIMAIRPSLSPAEIKALILDTARKALPLQMQGHKFGILDAEAALVKAREGLAYQHGDVNGDGLINMQDVLLIYQHVRGRVLLTGAGLAAADVNGKDGVTMQDVLLVYHFFRGIIHSFN